MIMEADLEMGRTTIKYNLPKYCMNTQRKAKRVAQQRLSVLCVLCVL